MVLCEPSQVIDAIGNTTGRASGAPLLEQNPAAGAADRPHRTAVASHSADRLFGLLAAALWGTWAWKLAPHVSCAANAQSLVGLAAICLVSLAWPTLAPLSYRRNRSRALAGLRVLLLCLPFNFDQAVLDLALPQQLAAGRLSSLVNLSHLISASHLDFLILTSLGWRLEPRAHMGLQAVMILVLCAFGVHPHCRGTLLSSPEVGELVQAAHGLLGLLAAAVAPFPPIQAILPADGYGQRVALLLLAWMTLGWLLPTLLLLRLKAAVAAAAAPASAAAREQQPAAASSSGDSRGSKDNESSVLLAAAAKADRAAAWLEAGLCTLLPSRATPPRAPPQGGGEQLSAGLLVLRWMLLILPLWMACCTVAPLYT